MKSLKAEVNHVKNVNTINVTCRVPPWNLNSEVKVFCSAFSLSPVVLNLSHGVKITMDCFWRWYEDEDCVHVVKTDGDVDDEDVARRHFLFASRACATFAIPSDPSPRVSIMSGTNR